MRDSVGNNKKLSFSELRKSALWGADEGDRRKLAIWWGGGALI